MNVLADTFNSKESDDELLKYFSVYPIEDELKIITHACSYGVCYGPFRFNKYFVLHAVKIDEHVQRGAFASGVQHQRGNTGI